MKFIPRRVIPVISATGVEISILGPSVNGKAWEFYFQPGLVVLAG